MNENEIVEAVDDFTDEIMDDLVGRAKDLGISPSEFLNRIAVEIHARLA